MVYTYNTITKPSQGIYKDKGSKFLSFAYPVTEESRIKELLADLKKEYYDARHHCFAWRLGSEGSLSRMSDDGEPSSTAGKPIFGQILSYELTNLLIVVVRYFGGTKLGVSGLITAYRAAAKDAIDNNEIITRNVESTLEVRFGYTEMNSVMKIIKDHDLCLLSQQFDNCCQITLRCELAQQERITGALEKVPGVSLQIAEQP